MRFTGRLRINIGSLDYKESEDMTWDLMRQDKVILYEPAFRFENLFIRVDILVKYGNTLRLIEVKSKSYDGKEGDSILTKAGKISSSWKSYLHDVAFQKYVLERACPESMVHSYLMMADKNAPCPTDGLNQKFRIRKDSKNRKGVNVSSTLTDEDLKDRILIEIPVDEYVHLIHTGTHDVGGNNVSFPDLIEFLSSHYEQDKKILPFINSNCRGCEFKCTHEQESAGFKSGFKECWKEILNWNESDFNDPNILELWNFRRKDLCIHSGKTKLKDLNKDDIKINPSMVPGMSPSERQWLQVEKVKNSDTSVEFDAIAMKTEMDTWTYPLHYIDFETSRVAIPFIKGRKPYEGIIFQFSHHIVHEGGKVEHAGQYLNTVRGAFPNYECVRELKNQLEKDNGTIFMYTKHENSFLLEVGEQLLNDLQPPSDKEELCDFIQSITKSNGRSGSRYMVDMWELVKKYYYDPSTHGSNSIKKVLPAILNSTSYLKDKYSKPVYGAQFGINSLNYVNWTWVKFDSDGKVIDPYKILPPVFDNDIDESIELMSEDNELNEGGAAMTAYCRMQFSEMTDYEREKLKAALLKYCELDTLAMVMIYEAWREMIVYPYIRPLSVDYDYPMA